MFRIVRIPVVLKEVIKTLKNEIQDILYFQAKKVDQNGASGLIPSQNLEEKRKAFVKPEYDYTHKSCKFIDLLKR